MKKETAVDYAVKNTFFLYLSNLIIEVVNLFISIYIIRKLSVETYGFYNFILGSMLFIQILTISSIVTIIVRFVPEMIENGSFRLLRKMTYLTYAAVAASIVLVSVCFLVFKANLGDFFKLPHLADYYKYIIFYMFTYIFLLLSKTYLSASLLQKEVTFANIVTSFIRIAVYLLFFKRINLYIIFSIESSVNLLNSVLMMNVYFDYLRKNAKNDTGKAIKNLKNRVVKYGLLSFFNEMGAGMISKASSYYVISAMSNAYLLGQYSFAYKINDIFMKIFPVEQISSVLRPIFFRKYVSSQDKSATLNKMYVFLYKFLLWILAPLCLYFISVSDIVIVNIFDPKYSDAYMITNIIFTFILFNAFQIPLSYVVLSMEHLEINLMSKIFLIYNIVGSILIIKHFGLIGVAFILGSSILFKNLFILIALRKYIKLSFPAASILRIMFAAMLPVPLNILAKNTMHIHPYIYLAETFILSISIFFIASKLINPFDSDEKEIVNMILKKMRVGFIKV